MRCLLIPAKTHYIRVLVNVGGLLTLSISVVASLLALRAVKWLIWISLKNNVRQSQLLIEEVSVVC